MRGVPGSGKSTKRQQILDLCKEYNISCGYGSADDFMVNKNGEYHFDFKKLDKCHRDCADIVYGLLENDYEVVILDNTNLVKSIYTKYVLKAKNHGYKVYQLNCNGGYKSIHNVPESSMERMRSKYEKDASLPEFSTENFFKILISKKQNC